MIRHAKPLYSVGTWDTNKQAYTPQRGGRCINISLRQLRAVLKRLRAIGYTAHRFGPKDDMGYREHNDSEVIIERTDGRSRKLILADWER